MPRKGPAERRELMPDPIYRSVVVTQLVNKVLLSGKRSTSEHIVYKALDEISRKTNGDPVTVLEARGRERPTAARGQEPARRRRDLPGAHRGAAPHGPRRSRSAGSSATRASAGRRRWPERLAGELLDASNGIGAAIKRREDLQKMAESNRAFAHYRW